jgi:hypothetical protein
MRLFDKMIHPYLKNKIYELGLPSDQKCVVLLDAWPVQLQEAFRAAIKAKYPYIILLFVPAGQGF